MTLQDAANFFERKTTETTKKTEIKIYKTFLHILTELKKRELSKDEIQSIETELDSLNLKSNPGNRKRYFRKALSKFEQYLNETFSLISKDYYTKLGAALGTTFGILFAVVFLSSWERSMGTSMGWLFGMLIGITIGRYMDAKALREGKVL